MAPAAVLAEDYAFLNDGFEHETQAISGAVIALEKAAKSALPTGSQPELREFCRSERRIASGEQVAAWIRGVREELLIGKRQDRSYREQTLALLRIWRSERQARPSQVMCAADPSRERQEKQQQRWDAPHQQSKENCEMMGSPLSGPSDCDRVTRCCA
jgi:hypothetical protein